MPGQQKTVCPHLGLVHDAATHMNFPSLVNQCRNCKKPVSPGFAHQQIYCLTDSYRNCTLNQTSQRIPASAEIRVFPMGTKGIAWFGMAIILLVGAIVFTLSWLTPRLVSDLSPAKTLPSFDGISALPAGTLPSTEYLAMTNTSSPDLLNTVTFSPQPSETPVLLEVARIYEVTKLPAYASHGLLIHMIVWGETLDTIASRYDTSVEAIMAVNYKLTPPVWADYPIVIPVNTKDASSLPAFKVYVVKEYENISAETLANLLAVDAKDFEYYNLCDGNCQFTKGDVLLVPYP
jgi:LysM repeat protein